ncbi:class 1b ribonucleoside-diphosphate reductase subunit beta [Clostridium disporicum]|uniref:class 1b ribonucleoside-diphosphate reductase subunit beta n=1 Tax=Clostridium disporicum TaxID=84024 RepID=UPI0034A0EA4B
MKKGIHKAINWNAPGHKFYDDIYLKQVEQFWLPEEINVSDDKSIWEELDPNIKVAYERILAGLTLLDTEQTVGITKVGDKTDNLFIKSILTLFAGFETIHARSYSTIFQTLCTNERIDELFDWIEHTKELQDKVAMIINTYESIEDKESLFMSMIGSLCLEGICFYSGFFLPLWLAGQGKMVNSGEIINLILRDEKLHTVGVGFFAKELFAEFSEEKQVELKEKAIEMIKSVYEAEYTYSKMLYKDLDFLDEVATYLEFNVNYALSCAGFEPMFDVTENDVNPIVMNGYSTETKTHDFFSTKGNGYVKTSKVENLDDDDFDFDFE